MAGLGKGRSRGGLVHGDTRRPFILPGRRWKILQGLGEEEEADAGEEKVAKGVFGWKG